MINFAPSNAQRYLWHHSMGPYSWGKNENKISKERGIVIVPRNLKYNSKIQLLLHN